MVADLAHRHSAHTATPDAMPNSAAIWAGSNVDMASP